MNESYFISKRPPLIFDTNFPFEKYMIFVSVLICCYFFDNLYVVILTYDKIKMSYVLLL